MPTNKDESAVEAAGNKAASGSGMVKAASWSDFVTKPAANKAAPASSIEPAARVEGKAKQAAAKVKAAATLSDFVTMPARNKPEPAVIAAGTERVDEDFIQYLRTRPMRRPPPISKILRISGLRLAERYRVAFAMGNELIDLYEDILRQHDEKGYALVRVERHDNGEKRMVRLPEVETA